MVVTGPPRRTPFALRVPAEVIRFGPTSSASGCCSSSRRSVRRRRAPCSSCGRDRSRREGPRPASTSAGGSRGGASTSSCTASGSRRRPAGRDRWRRRPAARARRGDARPWNHGRATPSARRDRARGGLGDRPRSRRRVPGQRSHAPARGLGPERRDHCGRCARGRTHRRRRPARRRGARDPRDPRVRARGRLAAVRRAGRGRGLARVARVARLAPARSLARAGVGALVLLAWTPRSRLEPGFQLSFAAVAAIFVALPRLRACRTAIPSRAGSGRARRRRRVRPRDGADRVAPVRRGRRSGRCPRTSLAEPAMPLLISLSLAAAALAPVLPGRGDALAWLAGWCAAWIALVARVVAGCPSAQVRSPIVIRGRPPGSSGRVLLVRRLPRLPPAHRGRGRRLARPHARVGRVRAAAAPDVDAAGRAARHVPRRRPGRRDPARDPGGAVLVDQGPPEAHVAGQLRRLGLRSLTAIVLTHPQRDHVGGAARVLDRLAVGAVADPESRRRRPSTTPRSPPHAITACRSSSCTRARRSGSGGCGSGSSGRTSRAPQRGSELSTPSCPRELRGDRRAAHRRRGADVTSRLPLRPVEVLKVAHHGSEDPGSPTCCASSDRGSR